LTQEQNKCFPSRSWSTSNWFGVAQRCIVGPRQGFDYASTTRTTSCVRTTHTNSIARFALLCNESCLCAGGGKHQAPLTFTVASFFFCNSSFMRLAWEAQHKLFDFLIPA
jgi:hypothetical protein